MALRRAPVVHRRHTSSEPNSDVKDVERLAVLDALHIISTQMACAMMFENIIGLANLATGLNLPGQYHPGQFLNGIFVKKREIAWGYYYYY